MKTDILLTTKDRQSDKSKPRELISNQKPKKSIFERNMKILINIESPKKKKAKTNSLQVNIFNRKNYVSSKVNKENIKELDEDMNIDFGNKGNNYDRRIVNSNRKDLNSKLRILNDEDEFNKSNIDDYEKNDDKENNEDSVSKPDPKKIDDNIIFDNNIVNDINNFNLSPIEMSLNSYFNKNVEVKKNNPVFKGNIDKDINKSNKKNKKKSFFCCF